MKCVEISIYNFNLRGKHYDHFFNKGTVFCLKEPFYKTSMAGTHILRVDNPKDIVLGSQEEALKIEGKERVSEVKVEEKVDEYAEKMEQFRTEGIKLVKDNKLIDAYVHYCDALKQAKDNDHKVKFLLNKAIVCSKLNLKK